MCIQFFYTFMGVLHFLGMLWRILPFHFLKCLFLNLTWVIFQQMFIEDIHMPATLLTHRSYKVLHDKFQSLWSIPSNLEVRVMGTDVTSASIKLNSRSHHKCPCLHAFVWDIFSTLNVFLFFFLFNKRLYFIQGTFFLEFLLLLSGAQW